MLQNCALSKVQLLHICYQIFLIKYFLADPAQRLWRNAQVIGYMVKLHPLKDFRKLPQQVLITLCCR